MNDLVDLHTVHFKLNHSSIFGKFGNVTGDTVTETGADGQDQVALCNGHIGSIGTVHAYHAQVRIVMIRNRALAHEGRYHGHAGGFHDLADKIRRVGRNNAAAGHQDRFLCLFKRSHRLVNGLFIPGKIRFVAAKVNFLRIHKLNFRPEHIRGNIN